MKKRQIQDSVNVLVKTRNKYHVKYKRPLTKISEEDRLALRQRLIDKLSGADKDQYLEYKKDIDAVRKPREGVSEAHRKTKIKRMNRKINALLFEVYGINVNKEVLCGSKK